MAPAMTTKPVAIVGGGLGGLSAALHLRRHGYDVALFEKNVQLGGRANRIVADGFQFDTGPSLLNYPWVCRELFAATGARFEDYVTLHAVEPTISFLWPDSTKLILSSHVDRLIASCSALEPGAGPGVMAFLRDARLKYDLAFSKLVTRNEDSALRWFSKLSLAEMARLSVWRSLYGQLGKYFRSSRIREALGSYGMYLGGSPFDLPGMFTILPYGEMAYGLWLPKGGVYALVEALRKRNAELGVALHTDAAVTRINAARGRVHSLTLADDAVFDAPIVVSNVEAPRYRRPTTGPRERPGRAPQTGEPTALHARRRDVLLGGPGPGAWHGPPHNLPAQRLPRRVPRPVPKRPHPLATALLHQHRLGDRPGSRPAGRQHSLRPDPDAPAQRARPLRLARRGRLAAHPGSSIACALTISISRRTASRMRRSTRPRTGASVSGSTTDPRSAPRTRCSRSGRSAWRTTPPNSRACTTQARARPRAPASPWCC